MIGWIQFPVILFLFKYNFWLFCNMITFFIDKFRNGFVDTGLFFLIYKNIQSNFLHSHAKLTWDRRSKPSTISCLRFSNSPFFWFKDAWINSVGFKFIWFSKICMSYYMKHSHHEQSCFSRTAILGNQTSVGRKHSCISA